MFQISECLKIFIAIFVLINPLAGIPMFLSKTEHINPKQRNAIAGKVFLGVLIILIFSQYLGKPLLGLFGISTPAFTISGGIIIFIIALGLIFKDSDSPDISKSPESLPVSKDFAIVPLSIPILAGPGVISTVILYSTKSAGLYEDLVFSAILLIVAFATWLSLRMAGNIEKFIHETGVNVMMKVSGLLVAAIGIELIVNGVRKMLPYMLPH